MSSIYQGGVNSENIAILLATIICDSKNCWFDGIETEFENRVALLTSQMSATDDLITMFAETYYADWYLAACKKFPFITSDGSSIIPIDDCSHEPDTTRIMLPSGILYPVFPAPHNWDAIAMEVFNEDIRNGYQNGMVSVRHTISFLDQHDAEYDCHTRVPYSLYSVYHNGIASGDTEHLSGHMYDYMLDVLVTDILVDIRRKMFEFVTRKN